MSHSDCVSSELSCENVMPEIEGKPSMDCALPTFLVPKCNNPDSYEDMIWVA